MAALAFAGPAPAVVSLFFVPTPEITTVGGTATVELRVSGLLDAPSPPALGAWRVDIDYNPAIASAASVTLGTELDLGVVGSVQFFDLTTPGTAVLDEVSFEAPGDLVAAQPDTFTLATLNVTGLAPGESPLTLRLVELSDENGDPMTGFTTTDGRIIVRDGTPGVPEGGAGLVLITLTWVGLVVCVGWRARRTRVRAA
jgi:hypothetical protein